MTIYEFMKVNASIIDLMRKNGINPNDLRYADIGIEAKEMLSKGEMKRVVVHILAEKFGISERNVYIQINKMDSDLIF